MTDITRLLASLKRRSAHAKEFGHDVLFVKLEDLDALVEALEKAQQKIQAHERAELTWMNALELPDDATRNDILPAIHAEKYTLRAANKRIAELEESHAQVIQSRDHYKRMSEEGLKQLAESRTVTVKLPKRSVGEVMHMSGFSRDYAEGWCAGNDNAIHEISNTAGIKWEAE
ncbi:ead/Ea22-like family protein [Klebsiella aerogenes]